MLHAESLHSTERIVTSIIGKRLCRHGVPSLYSQLNDFILAAIEWAQRCFQFWFSVHDTNTVYDYHTPRFLHTFFLWQSENQQCYSPCTWFLHLQGKKIQYFQYDACWTRCLNQIYENTNLHLLSVWRGFPYRNKGLGFPKPKLEVHKWNKSLVLTPKQTPFLQ